jgi:hypothetical protein
VGALGGSGAVRPHLPVLSQQYSTGLTAVLAETAVSAQEMARVMGALRQGRDDDERAAGVAGVLGDDRALVHLGPDAEDWALYLPRADWSLAIASPQRVPHVWDLSESLRRSGRRFMRLRAAGGDLVLALTLHADAATDAERRSAMADGGPAVLGLLCSDRFQDRAAFAGLVAEVL